MYVYGICLIGVEVLVDDMPTRIPHSDGTDKNIVLPFWSYKSWEDINVPDVTGYCVN